MWNCASDQWVPYLTGLSKSISSSPVSFVFDMRLDPMLSRGLLKKCGQMSSYLRRATDEVWELTHLAGHNAAEQSAERKALTGTRTFCFTRTVALAVF